LLGTLSSGSNAGWQLQALTPTYGEKIAVAVLGSGKWGKGGNAQTIGLQFVAFALGSGKSYR